ncbi:MAG: amidohydrolase [Terrimonas sp.]|nr:amidohydrolase [Terrimonas sp.]
MENHSQQLTPLRHWLHQHPEISGQEKNTADHVFSFLQTCNPDQLVRHIGGEGILALFDSGLPGPVILCRSELDALPIRETNDIAHRSVMENTMHACGHDGHTAILCGLAKRLSANKPALGKVYLLFQPAEETGEGAKKVMEDEQFNIRPDFVFALHNLPGFASGNIVIKQGLFSAAVQSVILKLMGKTTHAAEPESGINPALAISEMICLADRLKNQDPASEAYSLVTPIQIRMGSAAYGTAAGEGELHYTLRCRDQVHLDQLREQLVEGCHQIALTHGLSFSFELLQTFYANNNHAAANQLVKNAALDLGYTVEEREIPFQWGEDFGYFTSSFKGCMFGIGAGKNHPALHNPDYDFPDDLLDKGVNMFNRIIQLLSQHYV